MTMLAPSKTIQSLTAGDVMTSDVVQLPESMPLRDAVRLLLKHHIGGAPVVDAEGTCVGVISTKDLLRFFAVKSDRTEPGLSALPITCAYQAPQPRSDGTEAAGCTLPSGACPIQVEEIGPDGEKSIICSQPHCVLVDWQVVDVEKLPTDEVRRFMTADILTVSRTTSARVVARMMIDAHIHRIIVVDDADKPIGLVSSFDLLGALALTDNEVLSTLAVLDESSEVPA
jgi:CBS domain-containing protein